MTKYLKIAYAYVAALVSAAVNLFVSRLPLGIGQHTVSKALASLDRCRAQLAAAHAAALARAEAMSDKADFYADLADAAEDEADRAARVQLRLSRLLD
jgi:hypothetical protein